MIHQRLGDGEAIFPNFIFNPGTILANAIGPDRATVLEMQRFRGRHSTRGREPTAKEDGLSAHQLGV
jgi:hypothetical protein